MKFREKLNIPKIPERELVKEVYKLSKINWGVDDGFYPLGSCTMKYNPRINERIASFPEFCWGHPLLADLYEGSLAIIYELEQLLCKITGMDAFSLHPSAGAHGELLALMIAKKYFIEKKEYQRKYVLVPDSAHGTNPASAAMCRFEVKEVKSDERGNIDIKDLASKIGKESAVFMLTYPNTLGLADERIKDIVKICKDNGTLLYLDGANFNAIAGIVRPGDIGFDFVHLNLHKTFSTPHGGGGPAAGPLGVKENLKKYLPYPRVNLKQTNKEVKEGEPGGKEIEKEIFYLDYSNSESSVGKIESFFGNFPILVRAWVYIKMLGEEGIKKNSQTAVLNANYLQKKLTEKYHLPYNRICKHEFVLSEKGLGVKVEDLAKALQDEGFHPPTIYFPLIVKGAIMIEPTETETKDTLDKFAQAMLKLFDLSITNPDYFRDSPKKQAVKRVDIVKANRDIIPTDKERNNEKSNNSK
ncbi:MAG: aminomethyl-transferring glycine dehydrogenase subunit GcvPB [Candidatus Calescibacterium sp.]|nr:aminomethyl-transferring glycine dehydrogenase subunit GcvPB [Candidatus Calescibacterium sp.]